MQIVFEDHFSALIEGLAKLGRSFPPKADIELPPMPPLPCLPVIRENGASAAVTFALVPTQDFLFWHASIIDLLHRNA